MERPDVLELRFMHAEQMKSQGGQFFELAGAYESHGRTSRRRPSRSGTSATVRFLTPQAVPAELRAQGL